MMFHTFCFDKIGTKYQGSTRDSVSTWRRTRCQIAGLGVEVVFSEKGLEDSRRVLEALPSVGLRSNSEAAKVGTSIFKKGELTCFH